MDLLTINNVKKNYKVRKKGTSYQLNAVNDVSFSVKEGECVGLVGESGCGKSTLGRLITSLEVPDMGDIQFKGESVYGGKKKRFKFCQNIQMVFQDSLDAVNPRFTARQIVEEPLINLKKMSASERVDEVDKLLKQVGIPVDEKNKYAQEFSGGQLQRVCIARALASDPELIVLDEPLSCLDVSVQAQILNLLRDIKEQRKLSYILISHDLEAVYYLADALVVMYGGQIMERIEDISLFEKMVHPYTTMLLRSAPECREKFPEKEDATETIWMDLGVQKEGFEGCPYCGRCSMEISVCKEQRPVMRELEKGHFVACHKINKDI